MTIEHANGVTVAAFASDFLDASNAAEFKRQMSPVLASAGSSTVVLDVSTLTFVDSTGLGSLLACLRQMQKSGGDIKLCGMSKQVRTLFELVRMHRIFDIYNSKDEALLALRQ